MMKDISNEALYVGIAEEAAELSAAASKVVRILHGEIPARMTLEEATDKVQEEYTDLLIYLNEVGITPSNDIYDQKLERYKRVVQEKVNAKSNLEEKDRLIMDLKRKLAENEQEYRIAKHSEEMRSALYERWANKKK